MQVVYVTDSGAIDGEFEFSAEVELTNQLLGGVEDSHNCGVILARDGFDAGDVLFGDDEDVDRCDRMNVVKCNNRIILIADRRCDVVTRDFAKQTLGHFL